MRAFLPTFVMAAMVVPRFGCGAELGPPTISMTRAVVSSSGKPVQNADWYWIGAPILSDGPGEESLLASGSTNDNGQIIASWRMPADSSAVIGRVVVFTAEGPALSGVIAPVLEGEPSPEPTMKLVSSGELKIKLVDQQGHPAEGVEMWIADVSVMERGDLNFLLSGGYPKLAGSHWKGTTDKSGSLVIHHVPKSADVWLQHSDSRFAQIPGRFVNSLSDPKGDGQVYTFTLSPPGTVSGHISLPDGTPVKGAIVSIRENNLVHYVTAFGEKVHTNAQGQFDFKNVPPSPSGYHLQVSLPQPLNQEWIGTDIKDVQVAANVVKDIGEWKVVKAAIVTAKVKDAETGRTIAKEKVHRLAPGVHELRFNWLPVPYGYLQPDNRESISVTVNEGEHHQIEFKLQPAKTNDLVLGTVLGLDGNPAAGVSVQLSMKDEWDSPRPVKAAADGSFKLPVPKSAENLSAVAWDGDKSMSEPVAVTRGSKVTLQLKNSGFGKLEGQVVDEDGKPLKDVAVQLHMEEISFGLFDGPFPDFMPTDEDGRFVIPRYWASIASPYIGARHKGFADTYTDKLKLTPGKTTEVRITMLKPDSGNILAGVVLDAAGQPAPKVKLQFSSGNDLHHAVTDDDGRFRSEPLPKSDTFVLARWETDTFTSIKRMPIRAPNANVRLTMPPANGEVAGTVLGKDGHPLPDVEVSSAFDRGRKTRTDAEGKFALTGMVGGWFSADVIYFDADGSKQEHRFRLKTGMTDVILRISSLEKKPLPDLPLQLIGKPAPPLQISRWINSAPLPERAAGKVRILDFWGLQCAPCLATMPKIRDFWKLHRHEGVELIAVSSFYPEAEIKEFLTKHKDYTFSFAIEHDHGTMMTDYDIRGVPTYVVIDQAGNVASYGHDWDEAKAAALRLLPKP